MLRPRHVLVGAVVIDAAFFAIGAFLANYLIQQGSSYYIAGAVAVFVLFIGWRLFSIRDDRYRIRAFETLSDQIARTAEAYGIERIYNMQMPEEQTARNTDNQQSIQRQLWIRTRECVDAIRCNAASH